VEEDDSPIVKGKVIVKNAPAFDNATAHIYLENTSIADAGAVLVAEKEIKNIKHAESSFTVIQFELYKRTKKIKIDQRDFYSVRVWIDIDSDREESTGDLNTDQTYPVLTHGYGNTVEIIF